MRTNEFIQSLENSAAIPPIEIGGEYDPFGGDFYDKKID